MIPSITGSMQRRPFDTSCLQNWEYLWKDNVLADTIPTGIETSTIDLLIGNDYYLDLILPQKVEIQPGLYMLWSKLGWILAGRTSDSIQTTEEQSLLVITYGTDIGRQTNVFTPVDNVVLTVAIAFFLSTETHAKRLLTIWKRSVWTTLKRSFTVLANQSIVSETFQAFRILANQISVRKTLPWKPCLVANVSSFASLVNQNPADSSYLRSFFFFFFFFFFSFT